MVLGVKKFELLQNIEKRQIQETCLNINYV